LNIAYLVNHYPAVSHSFIRREILALEKGGVAVQRIALRGWDGPLADPADVLERTRTRFVLRQGAVELSRAMLATAFSHPGRAFAALRLATRMSRGSDRPLLWHWIYFAEACVVARWLGESGASHVHAHFGTNSAEVAMLAGVLADVGYSFTVHGPDEFDRPRAIGLAEKIRRAAFVVGISSFTRSQMFRWVERAHWSKIEVVHCGLDAAFHAGDPAGATASTSLVCVGRLGEQKGHLLLLDAMRRVFDRGHRFSLVLAGDGELRAAVEARVRELGLQGHVRITGWIGSEEVRRELLAARALVLPSFAEGLPVVIMEAMASEWTRARARASRRRSGGRQAGCPVSLGRVHARERRAACSLTWRAWRCGSWPYRCSRSRHCCSCRWCWHAVRVTFDNLPCRQMPVHGRALRCSCRRTTKPLASGLHSPPCVRNSRRAIACWLSRTTAAMRPPLLHEQRAPRSSSATTPLAGARATRSTSASGIWRPRRPMSSWWSTPTANSIRAASI